MNINLGSRKDLDPLNIKTMIVQIPIRVTNKAGINYIFVVVVKKKQMT